MNCLFSHEIFLCIQHVNIPYLSYFWIVKEKLITMDKFIIFFLKGFGWMNFENILAFLHFCLKLDLTKDKLLAII